MASITINNLSPATNLENESNNVLPIYQGNDNDGDTFKITPDKLVKQTLKIPEAGGNANKYLNEQGKWTIPPDSNTTYGLATLNDPGLMSTTQVQQLNSLATKDHAATQNSMGWMSETDKVQLLNLTTSLATTAAKGYMPKLSGNANQFLNGEGGWSSSEGTTYGIATTATDGLMDKNYVSHLDSAYAHAVTNKGIAVPGTTETKLYKFRTNNEGHVVQAFEVQKADIMNLGIPGNNTTYEMASSTSAGLMSSTDKIKMTDLITANATTTTRGYMPAEDKGKVDKIDNVWRWRYHDNITGTGIKFYRYGDIVFMNFLVTDTWYTPISYNKPQSQMTEAEKARAKAHIHQYFIPKGFYPHPAFSGQAAFYGGIFLSPTTSAVNGYSGVLRGSSHRDNGQYLFRIESYDIQNPTGTHIDHVQAQGELFAMWIADNAATNAPSQMTGIEAQVEKLTI